jgi:hypothetical protein
MGFSGPKQSKFLKSLQKLVSKLVGTVSVESSLAAKRLRITPSNRVRIREPHIATAPDQALLGSFIVRGWRNQPRLGP